MKLGFYGCGNMGEAILSAIRKNGAHKISDVIILGRDLGRMGKLEKTYHVRTTSNVSDLQECDIIILGVKPQSLKDIPVFESKKKIIVSLLAGTPIKKIAKTFPNGRYVRTMPNLGQFVEEGTTGIYYPPRFLTEHKEIIDGLFEAGGQIVQVEEEESLHALGSISGCGPAYFFLFAELLAQAAVDAGFDPKIGELLAKNTFIGAAKVIEANPDDTLAQWREKVTSAKGVTEQAILSFQKDKLGEIVGRAAKAAENKSIELGKE